MNLIRIFKGLKIKIKTSATNRAVELKPAGAKINPLFLIPYPLALVLLVVLLTASVGPALAHHGGTETDHLLEGITFDQKLNQSLPLELEFRDETGQLVHLRDYFGQKPVVLVMAYYECQNLCGVVLNGLLESFQELTFDVGDQFNVVTVSINPRETPALAAAKKETYLQAYNRAGAAAGWHFLTGEQAAIDRLAAAIGFHYTYDANTGQYAHPTGIMILTPQGKIARYLYGIEFPATDLRLGLVEAAENKIGSPVDQLLLLCYHYDPATGQYSLLITNVIRLAGTATVLALGGFLFIMFRR